MAPWIMDSILELRILPILRTQFRTRHHRLLPRNPPHKAVRISSASSLIANPYLRSYLAPHTILPVPMFLFPHSLNNSDLAGGKCMGHLVLDTMRTNSVGQVILKPRASFDEYEKDVGQSAFSYPDTSSYLLSVLIQHAGPDPVYHRRSLVLSSEMLLSFLFFISISFPERTVSAWF